MLKTYVFAVINWKAAYNKTFYYYKRFPSEFYADNWANRKSYKSKNSPYIVVLTGEKEF